MSSKRINGFFGITNVNNDRTGVLIGNGKIGLVIDTDFGDDGDVMELGDGDNGDWMDFGDVVDFGNMVNLDIDVVDFEDMIDLGGVVDLGDIGGMDFDDSGGMDLDDTSGIDFDDSGGMDLDDTGIGSEIDVGFDFLSLDNSFRKPKEEGTIIGDLPLIAVESKLTLLGSLRNSRLSFDTCLL